jgi:CubicO group peptidase (beta-lactamase class C family)
MIKQQTIGRRRFMATGASMTLAGLFFRQTDAADSATARIETLAEAARNELKAPGLAYGVIRRGDLPLKRGLGVKALGETASVDSTTLFHMASVTKPFVATVLAQRVEQGRLRLEQRLEDVLPEFRLNDPRARYITIEHLLTHTSGLADVRRKGLTDIEAYQWDRPEADAAALQRYLASLSDEKLLFAPGEGFAYSDIGFEVLARVIEVLDGVSFETAVRQTILTPLRMTRSTLFYPEANKAQLATPHVLDEKGEVQVSSVFPYNRPHAGSSTLLSCIDDMLRWLQFNLDDGTLEGVRILSSGTVRSMRRPRPVEITQGAFPPGARPALSWFVIPKNGRDIFAHPGHDLGFVSICLFCPQDRYGLVAMANCESEQGTAPLRRFAFAAIDAGLLAPA